MSNKLLEIAKKAGILLDENDPCDVISINEFAEEYRKIVIEEIASQFKETGIGKDIAKSIRAMAGEQHE